jgi:cell division protein FtsI (penicillin-binding protein 3)
VADSASSNATRRLYLLGGILFLWILVLGCRLVQLQVVHYGDWVQRGQRQQQRTIDVTPRRGIIYDRNGHELAMSIKVDSIFAVPSEVPDQANAASLLAPILNLDENELLARMKGSRNFCWVARKVDADLSARVRALNLKGIYSTPEPKRFYPKRELAAQVLGYVGLDDEGLGGIEREFDARLQGRPGRMLLSLDARRKGFGRVERNPDPGENVVLTMDEKIQYIAERELQAAMEQTQAVSGTVVVQNPRTGELLALANRPTFNPNTFAHTRPEWLKNHAVSDVYEPGSVFKLVTISAALDEKLTHPDEVIDCQMGSITIGGMRIRDHEALGLLTVSQILAKSSDVGAIKLGLRLGEERFDHYIRDFGFGVQTGIELPGETRGLTKPVSRWSKVSIGAISMGQEIGVSPIQMASLVSAIANDGVWTAPRIVAGVATPSSGPQTVVFHPAQQRRVVSTLTAAQMKKMMEGVVLFGTGRRAILDGYTSAGKTGTAQKVDPSTHAYSRSKYVASFAGFAPVNNPAVTIVVILDSAVGLHQGGQIAAPVFQRVAQQVLAYMNVPHDAELLNPRLQLLRASAKDSELVESSPDRLGEAVDVEETPPEAPAPPATAQAQPGAPPANPAPAAAIAAVPAPTGTVVVDVGGGTVVPSFLGKPLRLAVEAAQQAGIEIDAVGSGVARDQSPPPGSRLPAGAHVVVRFAR